MTPALGLLLTTCALVAAPAGENDPSARAEATLQRVVKLSPEQQQVWLRLVEQRYGWAVLITMKSDDAARERGRVAKILHQKSVPWKELVALLRQLDQREKAAVSHMVRVYRTQVYENFHKREKDLVDRQEAWYRIWSAWEKAGSQPEQQDLLMDWLAAAIKASSKNSLGPLPGDPKFGPDVELVPEALVKRLREERANRVAEAARSGRVEGPVPGPEVPIRGPLALKVPDPQWSASRTSNPVDVAIARGGEYPLPVESLAPQVQLPPRPNWPEPPAGDPVALTTPPAPSRPEAKLALDSKASSAVEPAKRLFAESDGRSEKPQALGSIRPPAELPPPRAIAPATEPAAPDRTPTTALLSAPAARNGSAADSGATPESAPPRDVLAMLPRQALQSTVPGPDRSTPFTVQRQPLALAAPPANAAAQHVRDGQHAPDDKLAQDDQHVQVNVDELHSRIEGINLSLRTLEGEARREARLHRRPA